MGTKIKISTIRVDLRGSIPALVQARWLYIVYCTDINLSDNYKYVDRITREHEEFSSNPIFEIIRTWTLSFHLRRQNLEISAPQEAVDAADSIESFKRLIRDSVSIDK